MHQRGEVFHKFKKVHEAGALRVQRVREPLDKLPGAVFAVQAADQVERGGIAGKSGGLDIEEENLLRRRDGLHGICKRQGKSFFNRNHGSTPFHIFPYYIRPGGGSQRLRERLPYGML